MGSVGAGALLGIVMAADYLDLQSVGPIALSLFGIVVTVVLIVAYQRWLAARLPERRARKHECPWCGYPVKGNVHCEGCGRDVIAPCSACSEPRRVGALHCGACGAA
jgi:energy-converting hydrogenase Eha subunit C